MQKEVIKQIKDLQMHNKSTILLVHNQLENKNTYLNHILKCLNKYAYLAPFVLAYLSLSTHLSDCLGELMTCHKLFSTYFQKFSKIAYGNSS